MTQNAISFIEIILNKASDWMETNGDDFLFSSFARALSPSLVVVVVVVQTNIIAYKRNRSHRFESDVLASRVAEINIAIKYRNGNKFDFFALDCFRYFNFFQINRAHCVAGIRISIFRNNNKKSSEKRTKWEEKRKSLSLLDVDASKSWIVKCPRSSHYAL